LPLAFRTLTYPAVRRVASGAALLEALDKAFGLDRCRAPVYRKRPREATSPSSVTVQGMVRTTSEKAILKSGAESAREAVV
jgi:hypothetical protein